MKRIDALMGATAEPELSELSILVDHAVAYEALEDATDALVRKMLASTAVRKSPRLHAVYRARAEDTVRAWIDAILAQKSNRSSQAQAG